MAFLARALLVAATTLLTAFSAPAANAAVYRHAGHRVAVSWVRAPHSRFHKRVTYMRRRPIRARVRPRISRRWLARKPHAIVRHAIWRRPVAKRRLMAMHKPMTKHRPIAKRKWKAKPHAQVHAIRLGAARWDRWQRAIAIPYTGNFPANHLGTTANPPRVFVDLKAAGPRYPQKASIKGQPSLIRFETASRGPDAMRVVLIFRHATPTRIENDRVRHEVLIVPEQQANRTHLAAVHHSAPMHEPMPMNTATPFPMSTEAPQGDQDPTLAAP